MAKRGRDTQEWKILRRQCYIRDKQANAPCAICGGDIDYSLKPSSDPMAWEPDHKYNVKNHPHLAEVPENIQPAHRKCNRAKKDKAGVSLLGNQSRDWS